MHNLVLQVKYLGLATETIFMQRVLISKWRCVKRKRSQLGEDL